jgi:hypothetical protein
VTDGRSGVVVDGGAAFAAVIDRLAADPAERIRLGRGAAEHARRNFDPVRSAQRMAQIFDELTATPRRLRARAPGGDESAGRRFALSLGDLGAAFTTSVDGTADDALAAADAEIAASPPGLVVGEGGIVHYRNSAPQDAHLRWWSALTAAAAGRDELARDEAAAAIAVGLDDARVARYVALWPDVGVVASTSRRGEPDTSSSATSNG